MNVFTEPLRELEAYNILRETLEEAGAAGRLSDSLPEGMTWRRIVTSQKYFWQRWQMILF